MAIQPTRPAGSVHRLVFSGLLTSGVNGAVYPKQNCTVPLDSVANVQTVIPLLLTNDPSFFSTPSTLPTSSFDENWESNYDITFAAADAVSESFIANIGTSSVVIDTLITGLGTNTGLPVILLKGTFGQAGAAFAGNPLSVNIEVRLIQSSSR